MKSKKRIVLVASVSFILVVIFTFIHMNTRVKVPKNNIALMTSSETQYIDLDALQLSPVSGQIVNGKGETKDISGQGILLRDVLDLLGKQSFSFVKVIADDEYSAEVFSEEIQEEDKVYLLVEDSKARLIVFGDENSKRNVSNVVRIELQY